MVKLFLLFSFLFTTLLADDINQTQELVAIDPLEVKIQSFLGEQRYHENREFINIIFDPHSDYYKNERLDTIKVVETLKENGLLNLFFESPREFRLNFKTSGSPLFFVKIMSDTLRNIGYYRYVTIASHMDASEFSWSINLRAEYATDPLILQQELHKNGCDIIDIQRDSQSEWTYSIDMAQGYLNIEMLENGKTLELKRSLYAHWLDVSGIDELVIESSLRNQWYPYIAYYDASLHLLKIIKENRIHRAISLDIPKNAKYIKVADLYTLKNVKDELKLLPKGSR